MFANIYHWKHLGLEIHLWIYLIISLVSSERISLFSWVPLLFIFIEIYSRYIVSTTLSEHLPYDMSKLLLWLLRTLLLYLDFSHLYCLFSQNLLIFPFEVHWWGGNKTILCSSFHSHLFFVQIIHMCVRMFIKMNI